MDVQKFQCKIRKTTHSKVLCHVKSCCSKPIICIIHELNGEQVRIFTLFQHIEIRQEVKLQQPYLERAGKNSLVSLPIYRLNTQSANLT